MRSVRLFPQGEVQGVVFFVLSIEDARVVEQVVYFSPGKLAVWKIFAELAHVEVDAAIGFISVATCDDLFDHFDLFHDVACCTWLDGRAFDVEDPHHIMEIIGVLLYDFHRFKVFEPRFLTNLIFSVIRVPGQVTNVGDVSHIAYLVAQEDEVPVDNVKREKRADVAQVYIAVHRWTTHVHAHIRGTQWSEEFLLSGQAILDIEGRMVGHKKGDVL